MGDQEKVIAALENPDWEWRTIDGISRETGLTTERVTEIVSVLSNQVVRSTGKKGHAIYTTRKRYNLSSGVLKRTLSVLSDRIK